MKEKQIEQKLVKAVRALGGLCPKLVSPGMDGMPDRMVLLPGGRMAFAELKAPGRKPRPLQLRRMAQLSRLGFKGSRIYYGASHSGSPAFHGVRQNRHNIKCHPGTDV